MKDDQQIDLSTLLIWIEVHRMGGNVPIAEAKWMTKDYTLKGEWSCGAMIDRIIMDPPPCYMIEINGDLVINTTEWKWGIIG